MKLTIGMQGAAPAAPDYAMLRASLVAAQAATPTARASGAAPPMLDPHAALHDLFADEAAAVPVGPAPADALDHRFRRDMPARDDGA